MINKIEVHTDGGARGNPGPAAVGVVIRAGDVLFEIKKTIGEATNNVAEYSALIEAIQALRDNEFDGPVSFFLDSELVVKQLNGQYKVKDESLKKLWHVVRQFVLERAQVVSFTHVAREKNKRADELVNEALDGI